MQGYCDIFSMDYFEADVDRSTCLHATSSWREVEHFGVSNVIYHKFSQGAVSYTLNGETVNVMLEYGEMESSISVLPQWGKLGCSDMWVCQSLEL